jgi:hypothetical protein
MQLSENLSFETLHDTIEYLLDGESGKFFSLPLGVTFSISREEQLVCLAQTREIHNFPVFDPLVMISLENGRAIPLSCLSEKHSQQDKRAQEGDWKAQEELLMFVGLWLKTLSDRGYFRLEPWQM